MSIAGCGAFHVKRTDVTDQSGYNCQILFGSSQILQTVDDNNWDLWQFYNPQGHL